MESIIRAIEIYPDRVRLLDQRKLPLVEEYVECHTYQEVAEAIRTMVVRGAPAIGVAAAGGIALGVQHLQSSSPEEIAAQLAKPEAEFADRDFIPCMRTINGEQITQQRHVGRLIVDDKYGPGRRCL